MPRSPVIDPEAYAAELRRKGFEVTLGMPALLRLADVQKPAEPAESDVLVEPSFWQAGVGKAVKWTIPLRTASEANGRDWRARSRRTKEAFAAVKKHCRPLSALTPFIWCIENKKDVVKIRVVRLGGRKLDPHDNLPSSLKATVDAICDRLGIDDGSPWVKVECSQEPGGPWGVRIEIF